MAGLCSSDSPQPTTRDQDPARPPPLRVLTGTAGGDAVLRLAGEIALTTTRSVAAAVDRCLRGRPGRLSVDLRAVTFCDCAGVRALRHARQQATAAGTSVRITALAPPVRRVLTLLKATDLLNAVVNGTPAAGRSLAASPGPGACAEPVSGPAR